MYSRCHYTKRCKSLRSHTGQRNIVSAVFKAGELIAVSALFQKVYFWSPEGRSWRNQSCICKLLVNSDYRIELTSMLKWLKLGLGRNWADWLYLSEDNISQRKFPSLSGCAATLNVTVDAVKGTRSLFANGVRSDFSDVQIAGQVVNKVAMRKFSPLVVLCSLSALRMSSRKCPTEKQAMNRMPFANSTAMWAAVQSSSPYAPQKQAEFLHSIAKHIIWIIYELRVSRRLLLSSSGEVHRSWGNRKYFVEYESFRKFGSKYLSKRTPGVHANL